MGEIQKSLQMTTATTEEATKTDVVDGDKNDGAKKGKKNKHNHHN